MQKDLFACKLIIEKLPATGSIVAAINTNIATAFDITTNTIVTVVAVINATNTIRFQG